MKKQFAFALILSSALVITACKTKQENFRATQVFEAMDTIVVISSYDDELVNKIAYEKSEAALKDIESKISVTREGSSIFNLNKKSEEALQKGQSKSTLQKGQSNSVSEPLSENTKNLLEYSLKMAELTDGAFNPCLYPVTKEWGFTTGSYKVPEETKIEELLKYTDYKKVQFLEDNSISLEAGMMIDLGGIGKGYAGDLIVQMRKENGSKAGIINLGGNVHCYGQKPDGQDWYLGVNPFGKGALIGIHYGEGTLITSGGVSRNFTADDGKTYIHIIDPKTGMPVENGLVSVTIINSCGAYGDALSTALFVMGSKKAIDFWKSNKADPFDFIIVEQNQGKDTYSVLYSEGLEGKICLEDSEYKDKVSGLIMIKK